MTDRLQPAAPLHNIRKVPLSEREPLAYYADNLGLAWNVLLAAWRGEVHPYEFAFIRKYGKSPEKLIPLWQERENEMQAWFDQPPKKQPQSEIDCTDYEYAPCRCPACEQRRMNLGLAVQLVESKKAGA